jgi:hypothetical protein
MSRRSILGTLPVALLTLLVLLPASALGAKPEIFHSHFQEELQDIDLCGINVDLVVDVRFTDHLFFDQEGNPIRFLSTASGTQTFTADNGNSVIVQFANQFFEGEPIIDEAAGTITFVTTFKGLPELIKTPHGGVLLRDAGLITFADTFDLETFDFISSEVIIRGPHPDAESDFELFCEVITEALA